MTITTQDTVPVTILIQDGTTITDTDGNAETWDGILQLANVLSTSNVSAPSGKVVDLVVSIGSATNDLTLDMPMKITISGHAGKTVSFKDSTGAQTEVTATCDSTDPATVTLGAGADCKIDGGSNLLVLTNHLTSLFTSSSSGGGGGGGDEIKPSLSIGFTENEFPITLDGVKYKHYELDKVHTTVAETGKQVEFTILVYENSGPQYVQHVEMYVNQFGPVIRNDLTETIIIYDGQSGIELRDPYNLISSASVIPSEVGNKAAFTFVTVFEKEIPLSDVVFRLWDTSRNSMQLHLRNSLVVSVPEKISGIPGVPEVAPEAEVPTINWTSEHLTVLKKWGGFHTESASDIDVLSEFGIEGEKIPPYFKRVVKWLLEDQISQEDFANALFFFKSEGILSDNIQKHSEQLTVLKKWGGFHTESASDIDVLSEFGIEGEKIPPYFKRVVKWILQDQISQDDFANALFFFKSEGILSDNIQK